MPIELAKPYVNELLVEHLQKLLDEAQSGEIVGMVAALSVKGACTDTVWFNSPTDDQFHVLGQLDRMRHLVHRRMDVNAELVETGS